MVEKTIGVLGGMGSYATLHFFEEILNVFPAEKEWERPRILIDNRCTMPSRVRAVLEGYQRELLVEQLCDSVRGLIRSGADKIILACNTSHCFLPDIYENVPEAKGRIVSIIEACCRSIAKAKETKVNLIASEGTIQSKVFEKELSKYGIEITYPKNEQYLMQRELIECVKQNKITEETLEKFKKLITYTTEQAIILGCTEFPVLFSKATKDAFPNIRVYDPLICALNEIKVFLA